MEEVTELLKATIPIIELHSAEQKSFNILEAAVKTRLKETTHSRILASLLKYKNGMLIQSFFETFFPESKFEEKKWDIYVEKNDIDIVLEGEANVIIVENKVNGACEQPGQIDRYVQFYFDSMPNKRRYVLYLNRETNSKPSPYSWSNTENLCELVAYNYSEDVRNWIGSISRCGEAKSDESLGYSLKQYNDYLEKMFSDKSMKKEIVEKIEDFFNESDCSDGAKIAELDKYINHLELLQEGCIELKDRLVWEDIQNQVNEYLRRDRAQSWDRLYSHKEMGWDLPDAGVPFVLNDCNIQFYAVISYLHQRYIGVINISQTCKNLNKLTDQFSEIFKDLGNTCYSTRRYPIWYKYSDNESLIRDYKKMLTYLKSSPHIKCCLLSSLDNHNDQ